MSMFEHEGQEYEELRAELEQAHTRVATLEVALREGRELAMRNLRKASQRIELWRWGDRIESLLEIAHAVRQERTP